MSQNKGLNLPSLPLVEVDSISLSAKSNRKVSQNMLFYNAELIIIAELLSKWENLYLSEYAHARAKKNVGWKIFLDKKTNALNICSTLRWVFCNIICFCKPIDCGRERRSLWDYKCFNNHPFVIIRNLINFLFILHHHRARG